MPDFFIDWLKTLDREQADKLDLYFDSTPHVREEALEILLKQHPNLLDFEG